MSEDRVDRRSALRPRWSHGLAAALTVGVLSMTSACTTDTPGQGAPAASAASSSTSTTPAPASSSASSPGSPAAVSSTQSTVPPSASGSPTYFTPADPSSFAMSGRIAVDQARQDPFSNLLRRGALHGQAVTLDVVGTPDYPVTTGTGTPILFGTCRCPDRGSGLRLTVDDATAVRVEAGGDVGIRGTFRPVVTASDAITLERT